jgi:hypothetical protein
VNQHELIDQRSMAFGKAIADRLRSQPELVLDAKRTLQRWIKTCSPRSASTLAEWQSILDGPVSGVTDVLTSRDERAVRLRQSNPFAGILSQQERTAIIRRFETHDTATA